MINLYSDTQSTPSDAMRHAMCDAPVGDEQKSTDPTVSRLLDAVAEELGKEAAIFMPSGTMCNAVAIAAHCARGDAVITEASSHIMRYEAGGMSALTGAIAEAIQGHQGQFSAEQVREHFNRGSRYTPATTLVSVEQSCNLAGGTVWPVERLDDVANTAKSLGMSSHMDGARLFNAAISSGRSAAEHCAGFDSVWVDFTKGLGAPFGAVLCGTPTFIDKAWRWKHRLGGAMRQAGVMAAACLYALEHNIERLQEDHDNAQLLNDLLKKIPGIEVRHERVETNIVYFSLTQTMITNDQFLERLLARGLKIGFVGSAFRAITYPGIRRADVEESAAIIAQTLNQP
ncbi:threonine aldolase [Pandoraea cepalis]|uniref:Threonine aldolase n=1 Tax=Pandoraea cepalis TaxID=2508294 RepID=A0A5E4T816_9BURK|nr:threonine aldolase family protein [Pandoraea cepalis]VVD84230.1 threonine aldolase [Pandoraea cepalis]